MLSAAKLNVNVEEDIEICELESKDPEDGHIATYVVPITFRDESGEWIGDLLVYFKVIGFGLDDFTGGIDTYYHIPAFLSGETGDEKFLEDVEAFQFIFSNFGQEVQNVVDLASDILFNHYEDGVPLISLFEE